MKNIIRVLSIFLICAVIAFSSPQLSAQIEVEGGMSSTDLVAALLNEGLEVVSVELNCPDTSYGIFEGGESAGLSIDQGIVLTSGQISDIPGNDEGSVSFPSGGGSDSFLEDLSGQTTNDACVLIIDLIPCGEVLTFNYIFGSDEYNEFTCSTFNDVFGFLISGPNPGGGDYVNENIALIPGTNLPVAINTVNNGVSSGGAEDCVLDYAEYFVDNEAGTFDVEYDGFTTTLTAFANVVPEMTYTLYLAIADATDSSWDSGVFIQASSLSAQFVDVEIVPSVEIEGIDNLVEGCIDGFINFTTTAPVTADYIIEYTLSGQLLMVKIMMSFLVLQLFQPDRRKL